VRGSQVSGTVTYGGKVVERGSITFEPTAAVAGGAVDHRCAHDSGGGWA
jgi:hypothetical protein